MPMSYRVAQSLDDVLDAWGLVYEAYRRQNLIRTNPCRIHTVGQAILSRSVVILSGDNRQPIHGTMSAYHDGSHGLPLDSVYQDELDALRAQGRRLVEIGLFADRRETVHRSLEALLELMRWTTWFAVHSGATDAVIGVHPRHADFYSRVLGFDTIGPTRTYSMVNGAPVTLLRLDWHRRAREVEGGGELRALRGFRWVMNHPLDPVDFVRRFDARLHAPGVHDIPGAPGHPGTPGITQSAAGAKLSRFLRHHAQPVYIQPDAQVCAA